MTENQVAAIVVDAAYRIHRRLGPGLFESAYAAVLTHELQKRQLRAEREKLVPLVYDEIRLDVAFRVDLLVENLVVVELKSLDVVAPVHKMQVLTYLRLMEKRLGLLINFGAPTIKQGLFRIVNNLNG